MTRLQSLERKLYHAELALEHDRVRAIKRGIKRLRGELCKPHVYLDAGGLWTCQRGMVMGVSESMAEACAEYFWYADQMEGAA